MNSYPPDRAFGADFREDFYSELSEDAPPFGTDEGWDALDEWSRRLPELQDQPTLRYTLGPDADTLIHESRHAPVRDADDITITAYGFSWLRLTGPSHPRVVRGSLIHLPVLRRR